MPRKYFRKYLPSHASIRENRFIARFGSLLTHHNLWHLHRRSVAGGVAAGLFAGLVPGPLQILTGAILAIVFRVNLPVAAFTTLYTNPLTIVPLYVVAYELGERVIGPDPAHVAPAAFSMEGKGWLDWMPALFDWLLSLGKPLAVGLPLLACLLAITGYVLVWYGWRLVVVIDWRRRHHRRRHRK